MMYYLKLMTQVHLLWNRNAVDEVIVGDIIIGNNYIGTRTTIFPGVHIGDNTIIGAGSVLTKDIPDNVVAAGIPCKVIRSRDEYIKKVLEIKAGNNSRY